MKYLETRSKIFRIRWSQRCETFNYILSFLHGKRKHNTVTFTNVGVPVGLATATAYVSESELSQFMTNLWNQDDNRASSHYVRYDLQGHSHTGHSGVDNAPNKWVTFSSIKPKLVWIIWRFTDFLKNILISKSLKIDITHMQTF